MSAESLVSQIIDRALDIGKSKSDAADKYASAAVTAASGSTGAPAHTKFHFTPTANIEPKVNIPSNATGVDGALYNSTYDKIILDLSGKFAEFFNTYFPNECNALAVAQEWMCGALTTGGSGIKPHVEDQIWQRERARTLRAAQAAGEQVLTTFAARGFSIPPGAAVHQINLAEQESFEKIAESSREQAIKQMEMELENIKFAVQNALDYRVKGIQAAADYIKTLAVGPQIAMQLATSAADAQAKLIGAATGYYNSRIRIEEIRADVEKSNASMFLDASKGRAQVFTSTMQTKASTVASVAQSLGSQAAAALNAVHASAGIAVQGEAN